MRASEAGRGSSDGTARDPPVRSQSGWPLSPCKPTEVTPQQLRLRRCAGRDNSVTMSHSQTIRRDHRYEGSHRRSRLTKTRVDSRRDDRTVMICYASLNWSFYTHTDAHWSPDLTQFSNDHHKSVSHVSVGIWELKRHMHFALFHFSSLQNQTTQLCRYFPCLKCLDMT